MAQPDSTSTGRGASRLDRVEWLPGEAGTGLLRVGGMLSSGAPPGSPPPVLALGGADPPQCVESLPVPPAGADRWSALYLLEAAALAGAGQARLTWPDGGAMDLPPVELGDPPASGNAVSDGEPTAEVVGEGGDPRGRVVDRAVLAERRARRAEEAGRRDSLAAAEARRAVGALEARLEQLTVERDALDARLESARAAAAALPTDGGTGGASGPRPTALGGEADLTRELERARAQLARADARDHERDAALGRTREALARLKRQLADLRLRMRSQAAAHAADSVRMAVLETQLAARLPRERAAAEEIERLREEVAGLLDSRRRDEAEIASLRAERARVEGDRRELQAALVAQRRRADGAEARAESLRRDLDAVRADLTSLSEQARTAVAQGAAAERRADRLADALAVARRQRAQSARGLEATQGSARAALADAAAGALEREHLHRELRARDARLAGLERGLADAEKRHDSLQAVLESERKLRRAQQARADALESRARDLESRARTAEGRARELERRLSDASALAERPPPAATADEAAGSAPAGLQERIAELERRAASRGELSTLFRAPAVTSPVAAPDPDGESVRRRMAEQLDAAAASLRAAADGRSTSERPADDEEEGENSSGRPDASRAPLEATVPQSTGASPEAAAQLTLRPAQSPARIARSWERPLEPREARRVALLRHALAGLAREDPFAAARLLAGLLPAQGAFLDTDIDYDLTIRELGTFAVTVEAGRTGVRVLRRPRSRHDAELHLSASSPVLVELLLGRPRRVGRLLAPVKLRGPRRRLAALGALAEARPTLADVARAGARLEPGLVLRALPYAVDPAWCSGHSFTVRQEIAGEVPQRWLITSGPRGMTVRPAAADTPADARVSLSRDCFERLVRGEPAARGDLPSIRGDLGAVELLRSWMERVRA